MAGIVAWAEKHFKPIGSGKGSVFDCSLTPWLRVPIEHANDGVTEENDLIAPIQSGKSTAGEIVLLHYLAHAHRGDCCYYWPTDTAAELRMKEHFERKYRACAPVVSRLPTNRHKVTNDLIAFDAFNFLMRGASTDRSVASDSFRLEVLEECHDLTGWTPGRIAQAEGRTTGYWDRVMYLISNAGTEGSELHKRWLNSTMQFWEVRCPRCGKYNQMHAKRHEDGSGLLYDMEGQPEHGEPDYVKLEPTLRYRFECGHEVLNKLADRRAISSTGRYCEPTNPRAPLSHRGYTYEAVTCHDIPWVRLVKEKQEAWAARKRGDGRLWGVYRRERECVFIPLVDRPEQKAVVLKAGVKKNRDGLPDRYIRFAAFDYQLGRDGEPPHYWGVIRDFMRNGDSRLVWEGKCADAAELVAIVNEHTVQPLDVCIDASFAPTDVIYPLCLSRGYCAIKVEGERGGMARVYKHGEAEHIYSEPQFLYKVAGASPTQEDPRLEPRFYLVSKWAAMERLAGLMASEIKWEVPEDVSEDYKTHMKCWTYSTRKAPTTGEPLPTWKSVSEKGDDHLYQCECYILVAADMEKLIGAVVLPEKPDQK